MTADEPETSAISLERAFAPEEPPPASPDHDGESRNSSVSSELRTAIEWVAVVVVAVSVAIVIKEFAFQAFEIPSRSMEPTVVPGDRILVNKLSYRFGEIERGDLLVFDRLPGTPGATDQLIKRTIGLPGETVEVREDGRLWIWPPDGSEADAVILDEPYLAENSIFMEVPSLSTPVTSDLWNENCVNRPRSPGRCTLAEGSYLVLGDSRNSSTDSRYFGPIPEENVLGRAILRIWPLTEFSTL